MHQETWIDILTDPNHIMAELVWNFVFDVIVITVGYGIIIKKIILPRIHKYIDDKHGVKHQKGEY
jgi:hypothetical protein